MIGRKHGMSRRDVPSMERQYAQVVRRGRSVAVIPPGGQVMPVLIELERREAARKARAAALRATERAAKDWERLVARKAERARKRRLRAKQRQRGQRR